MPRNLVDGMIVQATIVADDGGQTTLNRLRYKVLSHVGAAPTDLQFVLDFENAISGSFKGVMAVNCQYRGVMAQIISPLPVYARQVSTVGAGPGTYGPGGNSQATQVRGIVTWRTPLAKPANRGRIYLPFPSVAAVAANTHPTATYTAAAQAFGAAALTFGVVGSGGNTALMALGLFNPRTLTFTQITGQDSPSKWATQKRSGDYGRPNVPPI